MLVNEVPFQQVEEKAPLEPLRMEHLYFPLIILSGGLFFSALTFIVEIVIGRRERKDPL